MASRIFHQTLVTSYCNIVSQIRQTYHDVLQYLMQVLASVDRANWWHIFNFTLTIPPEDKANVPGKVRPTLYWVSRCQVPSQ